MEGSNQFRFGLGLGTDFIPFYSRRIGLFNGRIVSLDAGLKVLGQAGPFGIALLGTRMGASQNTSATNLYAGRVTYDVDPHLRMGLIGTYGNPDSRAPNNLAGFDAVWRSATFLGDKNFQVGAWGARSGGDLPAGSPDGWGFRVDYPNDLWDISVQANSYGDALDPALGFMPRAGVQTLFGGFYSGTLTQTDCFLTLASFSGRLRQTLDLENDFGHLPQGSFIFRVWRYKTLYAWNPGHFLSAYFQYDTDTHQLGMNARVVWIVRPGNDIYLVWDRNWVHIPESPSFSLARLGDEVALKVRWTFRW